jgi:hypothetical protein
MYDTLIDLLKQDFCLEHHRMSHLMGVIKGYENDKDAKQDNDICIGMGVQATYTAIKMRNLIKAMRRSEKIVAKQISSYKNFSHVEVGGIKFIADRKDNILVEVGSETFDISLDDFKNAMKALISK